MTRPSSSLGIEKTAFGTEKKKNLFYDNNYGIIKNVLLYEEINLYAVKKRAHFSLFPEFHCVSPFMVDALSPTTLFQLGIFQVYIKCI